MLRDDSEYSVAAKLSSHDQTRYVAPQCCNDKYEPVTVDLLGRVR